MLDLASFIIVVAAGTLFYWGTKALIKMLNNAPITVAEVRKERRSRELERFLKEFAVHRTNRS